MRDVCRQEIGQPGRGKSRVHAEEEEISHGRIYSRHDIFQKLLDYFRDCKVKVVQRKAITGKEFRLGEIEKLPVSNGSVDLIISNCVINLSPDKGKVFQEAFRVLKPGGRIMISDIVLLKELPSFIRDSIEAYAGCVSGQFEKTNTSKKYKEKF